MIRARQSKLELTPLLDVVFQILIFFVASLVVRGKMQKADFAEKEKEVEGRRLEFADLAEREGRARVEAQVALAQEHSRAGRLDEAVQKIGKDYEELAKKAGATEELLREIEKRFGDRAGETAALLSTVERHFHVYEITVYADHQVRLTYKDQDFLRPVADYRNIPALVEELLPAHFDPAISLFLLRRERETLGFFADVDFYPAARSKGWIVNDTPVDVGG